MRGTAPVLLALLCALVAMPAIAQQTAKDNGTNSTTPPPREAQTVITRLRSFAIPFDSAQARSEGAVAVQLLVSADRGANWQLYATQRAVVDQFNFRTDRDGEYWFASRRVMGDNSIRPETVSPELKVVIDATPPGLDFTASFDREGKQVSTSWKVTDVHPTAEQVRLEYRGVDEKSWHSVNLSEIGSQVSAASGQATWQPSASAFFLEVRLQVADQAGNTAATERRLLVPRVAALVSRSPKQQPSASTPPQDPFSSRRRANPGATPWPAEKSPSHEQPEAPETDTRNWRPNDIAGIHDSSTPGLLPDGDDASREAAVGESASDRGDPKTASTSRGETAADDGDETTFARSRETATSGARETASAAASAGAAETPRAATGRVPAPFTELTQIEPRQEPLAPPVANRIDADSAATNRTDTNRTDTIRSASRDIRRRAPADLGFTPDSASADSDPRPDDFAGSDTAGVLPAGEKAIMLKRHDFPLAYEVESVGPSGVAQVTLWATRDGGRTWKMWGDDPDRKSPIDVKVAREGTYGFRVVVTNGDGNASNPPVTGDAADVWVCVDTTPPTARITAAPYGVGSEAGQLNIEWQAADEHLADRPVTLLFTDDVAAGWTTIAAGLPNTGRYTWRVDPHVPPRVYLRLEVRDKAGNTGSYQLQEPINLGGLRPKARIRGVLPIDNTPRGAMLPRFFFR